MEEQVLRRPSAPLGDERGNLLVESHEGGYRNKVQRSCEEIASTALRKETRADVVSTQETFIMWIVFILG